MVSEGARPWGRGRSGDCETLLCLFCLGVSHDITMGHRADVPCGAKCHEGRGEGVAPFWRSANLSAKVLRDMGYRSDTEILRDMEPLS